MEKVITKPTTQIVQIDISRSVLKIDIQFPPSAPQTSANELALLSSLRQAFLESNLEVLGKLNAIAEKYNKKAGTQYKFDIVIDHL